MFRRRGASSVAEPWSLDRPLLHLSKHDRWTVRDACAGTLIFGDTGSGKTTGSGQSIAAAMLRAGFGGLVLTVKGNETDRWREYAARWGRESDLIVFSPGEGHRFNFLEHERTRTTRGGGNTENIVELLVTAVNACRGGPMVGGQDEYWDKALRQILRNAVDALRLADEPLSIDGLRRLILSAPLSDDQALDPDWQDRSPLYQALLTARDRVASDRDLQTLRVTTAYWLDEYAATMDPRTRGNIISTFTTTVDGFLRGDLHELFATTTTLTPEATLEGAIIVLDLPEKQFHDLGRAAQVVWKYCWQRAVEEARRSENDRPVFLWCDEAQYFVTSKDPGFFQTAREQKACCVYLTQSRSNYLHALGPGQHAALDSLLGVPKTKIFHCNGDPDTNAWAEKVISDDWMAQTSTSTSLAENGTAKGERDRRSVSTHHARTPKIPAAEFGALACGGPPDGVVEAVLFQSGRRFHESGSNVIRLAFRQSIEKAVRR